MLHNPIIKVGLALIASGILIRDWISGPNYHFVAGIIVGAITAILTVTSIDPESDKCALCYVAKCPFHEGTENE